MKYIKGDTMYLYSRIESTNTYFFTEAEFDMYYHLGTEDQDFYVMLYLRDICNRTVIGKMIDKSFPLEKQCI